LTTSIAFKPWEQHQWRCGKALVLGSNVATLVITLLTTLVPIAWSCLSVCLLWLIETGLKYVQPFARLVWKMMVWLASCGSETIQYLAQHFLEDICFHGSKPSVVLCCRMFSMQQRSADPAFAPGEMSFNETLAFQRFHDDSSWNYRRRLGTGLGVHVETSFVKQRLHC
jgi:hypothetical protein